MLTVRVKLVDKNVNSHVGKVMVKKAMNQRRRLGNMVKMARIMPAATPTLDGSAIGGRDDTTGTVEFCTTSCSALDAFATISESIFSRIFDSERSAAIDDCV
jgi:hypothetical protein